MFSAASVKPNASAKTTSTSTFNPIFRPKWDDDYEPYENRKVENGLTHWESLVNVFKACIGTGILALPEAFYYTGIINGIILYIVILVFGTYCFHVLLYSQYLLCKINKVGFLNYGQSVKAAFEVGPKCLQFFSKCAAPTIDIMIIIYQMGVLCVYLIFMAVNIQMVCDVYLEKQPLYIYFFWILIPTIFIVLIPNIKILTPCSTFANFVILFTIGVIAHYVSSDLPEFTSRPAFGNWQNYPLFFGTAFFAFLSVPIVVTVENNTEDPKWFRSTFGALNVGFTLVVILYILVGVMGYWKYGSDIQPSITLNFPPEEVLGQMVRVLYSFSICVTFGLSLMVPRGILLGTYILPRINEENASQAKMWCIDYTVRLTFILLCLIFSMCVPLLGLVISFCGGVALSLLGFVLPGLMEMCIYWPDEFGRLYYILLKDIVIILTGLLVMFSSFYATVRDMIEALKEEPSIQRLYSGNLSIH